MTWTQPLPLCYDETCPRELIVEVQETVLVFVNYYFIQRRHQRSIMPRIVLLLLLNWQQELTVPTESVN